MPVVARNDGVGAGETYRHYHPYNCVGAVESVDPRHHHNHHGETVGGLAEDYEAVMVSACLAILVVEAGDYDSHVAACSQAVAALLKRARLKQWVAEHTR